MKRIIQIGEICGTSEDEFKAVMSTLKDRADLSYRLQAGSTKAAYIYMEVN